MTETPSVAGSMYERLGVPQLVNAAGHLTKLGGSIMHPEVVAAMGEASRNFVSLPLLLERAGERIAELAGVEAAYITSGAAAGITLSVAACMAGADDARIHQLPDPTGMKDEVIIQVMERNYYELMIRLAGAKVVEIGMAAGKYRWPFPSWHLEAAINDRTAAIVQFPVFSTENGLPIADVIRIAQARGVPVIVDAADDYPPFGVLRRYLDLGVDLTIISGGKGLRGPQSTGLILGRRDLIKACAANANPIHGVGRPMKVGKEEIAGIVRAVEVASDEARSAAERAATEVRANVLLAALSDVPGTRAELVPFHNGVPNVHLIWTGEATKPPSQTVADLLAGQPSVVVGDAPDRIIIHANTLQPGEEQLVAARILQVLTRR